MRAYSAILGIALGLAGCVVDEDAAATDGGADVAVLDTDAGRDAGADAEAQSPDAAVDPLGTPCIRVLPEVLEFGAALQGRSTVRPIRLETCGDAAVEVLSARLSDDSDPAFALSDDSPTAPFTLPALSNQRTPPFESLLISFSPEDDRAYAGTLLLSTTDPERPVIEVPISGRGTHNECPVAVVGDAGPLMAQPLDTVELDGRLSMDADGPGGVPVRYIWTVIDQPEGSTAQAVERFQDPRRPLDTGIADDPSTPRALLFIDLAGTYVLELTVLDNLDLTAPSDVCPQPAATVTIDARPSADLHVQLTWNTPGDLDQTDGDGTDVNLHLRHPLGEDWFVAPFDCYYGNVSPDWGPAAELGDPSLDIDDINGAGPENIAVHAPEDTDMFGGPLYRIGVDYFSADNAATGGTWGPSEATVRVYLDGQLAAEYVGILEDTGHFWAVADIVWTPGDRRVIEVNQHMPGR